MLQTPRHGRKKKCAAYNGDIHEGRVRMARGCIIEILMELVHNVKLDRLVAAYLALFVLSAGVFFFKSCSCLEGSHTDLASAVIGCMSLSHPKSRSVAGEGSRTTSLGRDSAPCGQSSPEFVDRRCC